MNSLEKADLSYTIIQSKALGNMALQGAGGIFGTWVSLSIDAITLFTHYGDMVNKIRHIYGRAPVVMEDLKPVLGSLTKELIFDVIVDKGLGLIPIFGIGPNVICANAMTWRIGIVFTMLTSRGDDFCEDTISNCVELSRKVYPQEDAIRLKKPSKEVFFSLVKSVEDVTHEEFKDKIGSAISMFD
jgi:hypothetical protein